MFRSAIGKREFVRVTLLSVLLGILSTPALYAPTNPPAFRIPVTATVVGASIFLAGTNMGIFSIERLLVLILWSGFSTISLISALLNNNDLLPEFWQLFGLPLLVISVAPNALKEKSLYVILLSIILAFSPYIIVSLLNYPVIYPYKGVLYNPNDLGMIATTLLAACLAVLRGMIQAAKGVLGGLRKLILIFVILVLVVIVAATNSATSFGTITIVSLVFFVSLFSEPIKNRFWIMSYLVVACAVSVLIITITPDDSLFGSLVGKFMAKVEGSDILSGRDVVWREVLDNIEFFGMGVGSIANQFGFEPHNTYLWVLGTKGPFALLFYCAVQLQILFLAGKLAARQIKANGYAIGPLLIIVNYIVLGLSESIISILGEGIQMSYLLMLGVLTQKEINSTVAVGENKIK